MTIRVTPQGQANQIIGHLQRHTARLDVYQEQMATGKRLVRPSDGPAEDALVRASKAEHLRLETHLNNIRDAQFLLQNSESALLEVREILTEASQIAIEANNGAASEVANAAHEAEVEALMERLLAVVNRRLPDRRYLFSGTATDTVPFVQAQDATGNPIIVYQGSLQNVEAIIGRGQTVETIYSGKGPLEDAFTSLIALRSDLDLDSSDPIRSEKLSGRLDDIDQATTGVLEQLGDQGADAVSLRAILLRTEDLQFEIGRFATELESADLAETILNLQTEQNAFQATLLAASRINGLSLADFL